MTKNQLEYLGLKETERNNMVVSDELHRHQTATEAETAQHNRETERQGRDTIAEQGRHNLVTEAQGAQTIAEQGRHNLVTEGETERHDRATEKQAKRTTKVQAQTARYTANTQAKTSRQNAKTQAKASTKSARISAQASKENSKRQAEATKYSATKAAEAAKYAADMSRLAQEGHDAASKWNTLRSNESKERVAKLQRETQEYISRLDMIMKGKEISAKKRTEYEKMKADYKRAMDQKKWDLAGKILDNMADLIPTKSNKSK